MRVAVVYDRVNKVGGAEKILENIHEIWPQAPLFTSVYDSESAGWASGWTIIPSFLQRFRIARSHHEWFFWLMPIVFESFDFRNYDVVISVTSAEAKGIITLPKTLHICYLLTPTRYFWSQERLYTRSNPLGLLGKLVLPKIISRLKIWDLIASNRPDVIVAISKSIAEKTKVYYKRSVERVIYPPVDVGRFIDTQDFSKSEDYYLIVSRLVPSKKIEVAIRAFNQSGQKLVVIGTGVEEKKLKRLAGRNIEMLGLVSDEKLVDYYKNCRALIFPQEEDFGIVAVESLSCGKPVVAYAKGGVLEIVTDGVTGVLFNKQTPEAIISAVAKLDKITFDKVKMVQAAKKFDKLVFRKKFKQFVEEQWEKQVQQD